MEHEETELPVEPDEPTADDDELEDVEEDDEPKVDDPEYILPDEGDIGSEMEVPDE